MDLTSAASTPLRFARPLLRTTRDLAARAATEALRLPGRLLIRPVHDHQPPPPPPPRAAPRPGRAPEPVPPVTEVAEAAGATIGEGPHVDREPVLAGSFADEGAEDGAGAQVRVGEPWPGYRQMTAADVRDRLAAATPEALAAVRLYETAHRGRRTILDEVDRRLR